MFMSFNARAVGLDLGAFETIDLAADAGFGGVDLMARDLVRAGLDPHSVRARMDDLGLRGGAFPLPVHWRGTLDEFARDLEALPRFAEAAAVLGLTRTGTWVMPETPEPTGRGGCVALHVERLGKIARVLNPFGIRLGLEVVGVASSRTGPGEPFVCRLSDLNPVLGAVWDESPNLGILVDAWHLYAAHEGVEAALNWGADRVVWVHVADLPEGASDDRAAMIDHYRGLPGEHGAVESRLMLAEFDRLGYDGPVTAEPMANCRRLAGLTPARAVELVAESLRSVWPGAR